MSQLSKLWSGGNAYDPADDWLVDLANRQHAEIERLQTDRDEAQDCLASIEAIASEHAGLEADPENESPTDMHAHRNGLILQLIREARKR